VVGAPPLLILDEPTTGLDPITRRGVWELLAQLKTDSTDRAFVLATHSMEEVRVMQLLIAELLCC
jgi:ABC-type multidrug transport system ATPase subunit